MSEPKRSSFLPKWAREGRWERGEFPDIGPAGEEDQVSDDELLSRARVFDAGPPPTVNQFILDEDDDQPMNLTVEFRGKTGWAICNGRCCLSKEDDDFEYETFPSSRTEDFIARTRFASPQEAFAFLAEWKPKQREAALQSPHMIRWKDQQAKWASERKND